MFKCERCGKITALKENETKVIISKMDKEYQYKDKEGYQKTSKGWEITKEICICNVCSGKKAI